MSMYMNSGVSYAQFCCDGTAIQTSTKATNISIMLFIVICSDRLLQAEELLIITQYNT
jgi:hypothetical protein